MVVVDWTDSGLLLPTTYYGSTYKAFWTYLHTYAYPAFSSPKDKDGQGQTIPFSIPKFG